MDKLESVAVEGDSPQYCWVAVCILTHGGNLGGGIHGVIGCNGVGVPTEKVNSEINFFIDTFYQQIVNLFTAAPNSKSLQSKPKLFFFQVSLNLMSSFFLTLFSRHANQLIKDDKRNRLHGKLLINND